jgi:hypothetical protein
VLERNVEIRQNAAAAIRHQRHDFVDVRIGVDIVQPHPRAVLFRERSECLDQLSHSRLERPAAPEAGPISDIDTIGTGVLGDDEQFAHPRLEQALGFVHDIGEWPADQIAPH